MPIWFRVLFFITVFASGIFLGYQIRLVRMKKRNLKHYEKGEPLEGGVDRRD